MKENVQKFNNVAESFDRIKARIENIEKTTLADIKRNITLGRFENEENVTVLFAKLNLEIEQLKEQLNEVTV